MCETWIVTAIWMLPIGLGIGFLIGFCCGTWLESRVWLDAVCGREKIVRAPKSETADV